MPMEINRKREFVVGRDYHMEATPGFVIGCIERYGVKQVVGKHCKDSAETVIARLRAMPDGDVIPTGDCNHHDAHGHCLGHEPK